MEKLTNAAFEGKTEVNIPSNAEILKKDVRITVREIENGYVISKSYDIKYSMDGDTNWEYYSREWFSEENPLKLDETITEEKSLADKLD